MVTRSFFEKNLFSNLKTKEDYLLWLKSIKYLNTLKSINKELELEIFKKLSFLFKSSKVK